jgi:hypothetical protein
MTVTAVMYGGFLQSLANKQINFNSDTFKVVLLGSGYTPSDSHRYYSDISANEVTGTGYTAGGLALSAPTVSYASDTLTVGASAVIQWTSSTISNAWYAAVVDVTPGSASTNPLVSYVAFGQAESDTGGTFQITWGANGIAQITHS